MKGSIINAKLFSILILGIIVLSSLGCREEECFVEYPKVAYVNDEIEIKMRLYKTQIMGIAPRIAMQIPEDWIFLTLDSDYVYISDFETSNYIANDAKEKMGLKIGYKWIGGGNITGRGFSILDNNIEIKLRIGNNAKSALLDFAACDSLKGSNWEYRINNASNSKLF